ncbi:MAG: hypothetical protein K2K58_09630, partial [Muribaculaceae bacterium]|nr:hypothetical protein [Muribaculaceae bacterium]
MKLQLRFTYIILSFFSLFSVLFLSCGESIKNPHLLQAESLVEFYPDSALSLLNNITPSELSNDDEKMLRRLLILAAKDRKYEGQPDSVEIKALLNYFICNDRLRRIHPLVYYYAGRTYSDLSIHAKALGYYKKSLRSIDDKGDLLLERRIHAQIAVLYTQNSINRHALKESKIYAALSDSIARLDPSYDNSFDKVTAYLFLGYAYRRTQMNDSALLIYDLIAPEVKALKDSVKMTEYNIGLANLYIADNQPEKADSVIKNNNLSVDKASKSYVYISAAEVERHLPSPNFNETQKLALLHSQPPEDRYYAARTPADIAAMKNDGNNLIKYSRLAHKLSYRLQKATNDASL